MSQPARDVSEQESVPLLGLALLGISALSMVVRFYGIATESIWLDEATSLMLARMDIPTLVEWTALDIHPPLYYVLLHYWIGLGESEAVVRGLSLLAGVGNVLIIYALGRELFDGRTGLLAALLLAVSPFHIWYCQEARMYAWVTTLTSSSVLLAIKAWRRPRLATWVGYVVVSTASLYTHYFAVFAILIQNLFFLYLLLRGRADARLLRAWIASQIAVFLLFLPWFPTFLLPITVGGGGWVAAGPGKPSVWGLLHTLVLYTVGSGHEYLPTLVRRGGYVLFAGVFALGLWARGGSEGRTSQEASLGGEPLYEQREAMAFCLAYLVLPLVIAWGSSQVFKPMYSERYMLPFLIPFLLLIARGVRNVSLSGARMVILLALVAIMGIGVEAQVRVADKPDWRGLASRLTREAQEGDLALFMPGFHAKPFDYYARGALSLYSEVPIPVDRYGAEVTRAVEDAISDHPRVWLVWEVDHYTDPGGVVYGYLNGRLRRVSETQMPLVGRVVLYENPDAGGGS